MSNLHKCPQCGCKIIITDLGELYRDRGTAKETSEKDPIEQLQSLISHTRLELIDLIDQKTMANTARVERLEKILTHPNGETLRNEFIAIRDHIAVPAKQKADALEERVEKLEEIISRYVVPAKRTLTDDQIKKLIDLIRRT